MPVALTDVLTELPLPEDLLAPLMLAGAVTVRDAARMVYGPVTWQNRERTGTSCDRDCGVQHLGRNRLLQAQKLLRDENLEELLENAVREDMRSGCWADGFIRESLKDVSGLDDQDWAALRVCCEWVMDDALPLMAGEPDIPDPSTQERILFARYVRGFSWKLAVAGEAYDESDMEVVRDLLLNAAAECLRSVLEKREQVSNGHRRAVPAPTAELWTIRVLTRDGKVERTIQPPSPPPPGARTGWRLEAAKSAVEAEMRELKGQYPKALEALRLFEQEGFYFSDYFTEFILSSEHGIDMDEMDLLLDMPLERLHLPVQYEQAFKDAGLQTVEDLGCSLWGDAEFRTMACIAAGEEAVWVARAYTRYLNIHEQMAIQAEAHAECHAMDYFFDDCMSQYSEDLAAVWDELTALREDEAELQMETMLNSMRCTLCDALNCVETIRQLFEALYILHYNLATAARLASLSEVEAMDRMTNFRYTFAASYCGTCYNLLGALMPDGLGIADFLADDDESEEEGEDEEEDGFDEDEEQDPEDESEWDGEEEENEED